MKKYLIVFISFSMLVFSCKQNAEKTVTDESISKTIGTVNTDSIAPPVVTPITAANAPKVIPAAKPKLVQLKYPYGIGKPSIVNYSVSDGLSQNLVQDMVMDKKGNLWIGTYGGLTKFDGTHFTIFGANNGMSNGLINDLLIDKNDNLWIVEYEKIYRFDGQSFRAIPLLSYDKLFIGDLHEDQEGTIWVSTDKGIFSIKDNSVTHFEIKEGIKDLMVFDIYSNKQGQVFVNTIKGVFVLEKNRFIPYLPGRNINSIRAFLVGKDREDNLWMARKNVHDKNIVLIKYAGADSIIYSVKEGFTVSSSVTSLMEDKNGMIWISTREEGLIRFDGKQFIYYTTKDGLPSNWIQCSIEDDAGNIWVATQNGISRLSYSFMNNLETIATNEQNAQFAITPDGTKWVVSKNSLIQYRKKDAMVYDLTALQVKTFARSIFADHTGQLWLYIFGNDNVNVPGRMARFDGKNFYLYGKEQGINLKYNLQILEDKLGNIWFSGDGGVYKFDGHTMTKYGTAQGFFNPSSACFKDSKGDCWLGTFDSVLYKFDGTHVTSYSKQDGFPGSYINNINEDPFGNIWIASDKGVSKFDGKRFKGYGHIAGLDNVVVGVEMDTTRRLLWFSSIAGLVSMGFDEINAAEPVVHLYNQRNGFEIIPSHLNYSKIYFDSLGIWNFGLNGIYRFDYDKVKQSKTTLLQIRNIRLDNQQVAWSNIYKRKMNTHDSLVLLNETALKFGKPLDAKKRQEQQAAFGAISFDSLQKGSLIPENLVLPYKNNSITFEFATSSPSFGKYTQYRYTLEGYTKNWSPLSTKDEAFFGNMNEGKYIFHLQAISTLGALSALSYSFRVLPPWYRTWWAYALYVLVLLSGIFLFIRWRTKALQKEKQILEEKVTTRTSELNQSLENLKSTQSQLIQAEKMASLGELTAGIAHEIQNPLNFVNNFSEVNQEMLEELKAERLKPNTERDDDLQNDLINDVIANSEKITHHGKRADVIVKGMLQHSSAGSGKRESTDVNALCDEYLRLAYHGLRAKDKNFNATMKTDFDESIDNINIIPQDIGRVILNLITNAFYVVNEKKKSGIEGYEPTVTVSTSRSPLLGRGVGGEVSITVKDNGNGIPQKILDKIFQPFFTTKPTGQGTGLGLSLSYDIVKAHGGELKVETKEGEGSEFIIQLPI
jgi:signal transduction histidine kinase/ligand-binding sensor domain-containing protein